MTERQFMHLVKYATRLGIRTFGELAAYKKAKQAKTNGDLIAAMWQDIQANRLAS